MFMNRFIDPATIKTIDFYDRLLYKYYGKVYHGEPLLFVASRVRK